MDSLATAVGTTPAGLRLITSFLLGYPLAIAHRRWLASKSANAQHVFFATSGLLLMLFNYGTDTKHSLINIAVTYLILATAGRTQIGLAINFVFCMSYLLWGYYTMADGSYDISWTMPHCILCLRLIGVSFDYIDGGVKNTESLPSESRATALKDLPTPLEVLGHTYFFGACLVGPQFPMKLYQKFVAGELWPDQKRQEPTSASYALNRLAFGAIGLICYQIAVSIINDDYIMSDEFLNSSFLKRWMTLGLFSTVTLHKYISCWLLAEGSCALTGITHTVRDGHTYWDGLKNVSLLELESTTTFGGIIRSFNINTNKWVAQYIFKRLKFLKNKHISHMATLVFLAVWHGVHIGYYMCFLMEFIVMSFEKDFTAIVEMIPPLNRLIYSDSLKWQRLVFMKLHVATLLGYCLAPFTLLSFSRFHPVYASFYYLPTLLLLVWFAASFKVMPMISKATRRYREPVKKKD